VEAVYIIGDFSVKSFDKKEFMIEPKKEARCT
jgi:hypothetical protein